MKCQDQELQNAFNFREKLKSSTKEFTGKDFISYLHESGNPKSLSRNELVIYVQENYCSPNKTDNLIYPQGTAFIFEDSSRKKYKFIQDQFEDFKKEKFFLNIDQNSQKEKFFYQYEDVSKRPGLSLLEKIEDILGNMYAEHSNEKGTEINYTNLFDSYIFQWKLMPLLRKLPFINLNDFFENEPLIKSFFINIYNILMVHARCIEHKKSKIEKKFDIKGISTTYSYVIGGLPFTLDEIKIGILQANRPIIKMFWKFKMCSPAKTLISPLSPKRSLVLQKTDHRINFALNAGTRSSPAIRVYNEKHIDFDLDMATKNFVQDNTTIWPRVKGHTMLVSKQFFFAKEDYGNEFDIVEFIIKNLRDKIFQAQLEKEYHDNPHSIRVVFHRFEWAVNNTSI